MVFLEMQKQWHSSTTIVGIGSDEPVSIQSAFCGTPFPDAKRKDSISWNLTPNGKFSIKSVWEAWRAKSGRVERFKLLWKPLNIPKHSFTSWLIILDRSSFKDKQSKWGDPLILFVFCGSMQINIETTFSFECQFTRKIWTKVLLKCNMHRQVREINNLLV